MPPRSTPLITNEIYHILNRGNAATPIYKSKKDYFMFTEAFCYYQHACPPFKFSKFKTLNLNQKNSILKELNSKKNYQIEIIAYCLMPNHYHFLVKQIKDNGVLNFMRLLTDSYSHYFNIKYERRGSLFEGRFKAIRIENETQLLHLSRYIHLNPYSSFVVRNIKELFSYPFSSFPEYLNPTQSSICFKSLVMAQFKTPKDYQQFVVDQADYQRNLDKIKHQLFEK